MKRIAQKYLVGLFVLSLSFFLLAFGPVKAETAKHYTDLEFPPLAEIKLPPYTKYELDNGMTVFLLPDRELPLVSGTALVRTGDRFEPAAQVGLADILGEVMRTGGTKRHSPDELNELLEQRAAYVETSIGATSGSVSFNALSEDLNQVFPLFVEVLREPVFAEKQLELAKKQRSGAIARRNDDPNSIVGREFQKLVYGSNSPYARTIEYTTVNNISRDDLLAFYQTYFQPQNIILGIVGDFEPTKMLAVIRQQFGDWKGESSVSTAASLPPAQVSPAPPGGVFFISQPQLTQSYVQMGHIGGTLAAPDYPALSVLNGVLNGFGGRMFNSVRSKKGLAYSVYAVWSPQYDYPGLFVAGGQTRSEATVPLIKAIRAEIDRIRDRPITATELEYAKDSTLNSFVFNFADTGRILSRLLRYEYFRYPKDFLYQYQRQVEATTVSDVQRVAQKYLQPEQMVTLVVGNEGEINPPLSTLKPNANVTSIDISIPEPQNS